MADLDLTIRIAQSLTGQETTAQLQKLTSVLTGTARETEALELANIAAQAALDGSTAQLSELKGKLGNTQKEYARLKRDADAAAKALSVDVAKGVASPRVTAQAAAAADAFAEVETRLKRVNAEVSAATKINAGFAQQLKNVQKVTTHVGRSNEALTSKLSKAEAAFGSIGGPVGRLGQTLIRPAKGFTELSSAVGSGNAAILAGISAYAALAVAIVAVTAVAVVFTAAIAAAALKLADVRRSAALTAEAFDALNPEVAAVRGEFAGITRDTGVSSARLQDLAASLADAKVSAEEMPAALRAAALAEAALGQGGASKFISQIKAGELAVSDFATSTQQKLGGIVANQMMGLGSQADTLKRNMSGLFGGLNIETALTGISKLVGLFDQTTAAGSAVKFLFEKFFQPLIDSVNTAATAIEAFALGVLIGLVSMYIKLKPVIKAVSEFFGFDDPTTEETFKKITAAGEFIAPILVGLGAAFLVLVGLLAGATALIALPFVTAGAIIYAAVSAIIAVVQTLTSAFTAAFEFVAGINWGELGTQIMQGLAAGITNAVTAVVQAVTGAVTATIGAAKSLLGISSPSKVFAQIGVFTGEGFAGGIEAETEHAQDALATMVEPPPPPDTALSTMATGAPDTAATPEPASGAGAGIDLSGATFNFYGVENAEQAEERFSEVLTRLLEGDAAALGAA